MSDTKLCPNCGKNIDSSKFFLHERMCSQNVKKCPKCNKPFTIDELEDHIEAVHGEEECEYCKKKYPKSEIEKHRKKCDSKMVPCAYCELDVLLGELKEHQKACGAITEPCIKCGRYIQRKEMETHLLEGCPPPKNDRRSVDVVHNNRNSNDILNDEAERKGDIKIHNNYNKPNLPIRPASGKKVLNDNVKKNIGNSGDNHFNKAINELNNIINNDKSKTNNNNANINNYLNKQNNDKGAIPLKPLNSKNIPTNSRYNNNNRRPSKPSFATNKSKVSLNSISTKSKNNDEEFRKTREKLNFSGAKEIEKMKMSNGMKFAPKLNENKGIINDDDYVANFNFGDVDGDGDMDDQLIQQAIEKSLKDKK